GARITLDKRIPVAAGLGGGSTDAAAVLLGLNRLWRLRWPVARLDEVATGPGMDVPFFLRGGTALATGRGERVERLRGRALGLVAAGAPGAVMSGSGLTVFGVARSFEHARQMRRRLTRGSWDCWAVRTLTGPAIRVVAG